jgi:archaellum component FlaC
MKIQSENDFGKLRDHVRSYKHKFPLFVHDVRQLEDKIEKHIKEYSQLLVKHRQTKSKYYLEQALKEIESINKTVAVVEKIELMSYLSQR